MLKCMIFEDFTFFNIRGLQNPNADYVATDANGKKYLFNFCQYAKKQCNSSPVYAMRRSTDSSTCDYKLSGTGVESISNKLIKKEGKVDKHLEITYFKGDTCGGDKTYRFTVKLMCSKDIKFKATTP